MDRLLIEWLSLFNWIFNKIENNIFGIFIAKAFLITLVNVLEEVKNRSLLKFFYSWKMKARITQNEYINRTNSYLSYAYFKVNVLVRIFQNYWKKVKLRALLSLNFHSKFLKTGEKLKKFQKLNEEKFFLEINQKEAVICSAEKKYEELKQIYMIYSNKDLAYQKKISEIEVWEFSKRNYEESEIIEKIEELRNENADLQEKLTAVEASLQDFLEENDEIVKKD